MISRPAGAELKVPAGFQVNIVAENFSDARWLALAPNGDVFLAEENRGSIVVLRDANNDGIADIRGYFAQGLNGPFGMAFHGGYLYVGNNDRVVRFKYRPGLMRADGPPEKLVDLPPSGHATRNIIFNPDGKKMFVAVGSYSNNSTGEDPRRAAINEYNPDGTGHRIFASGLRNPVGLAFQPGTSILWTAVNERDRLGDDLVPDYITSVRDGGFYGWPYSYIGKNYDPAHASKARDLVERAIVPDVLLPAHAAALGITFYTGTQFPRHYRGGAFVALHGSWNRSRFSGYKVVYVPFENGKPGGAVEDFVTGWIVSDDNRTVWGRPVGVIVATDGSLLISDDGGGRIWRVSYRGSD